MTDFGRTDDPHRAIGSNVLAAECVEHIPAANSALPDVRIPIVVCSENVVSLNNNNYVSHNDVAKLIVDPMFAARSTPANANTFKTRQRVKATKKLEQLESIGPELN